MRGRDSQNPKYRGKRRGGELKQMLEFQQDENKCNSLTTVNKDNLVYEETLSSRL